MGTMTETLRSDEVRKGRAYEIQGSEAKHATDCAPVTDLLNKVNLSATGETQSSGGSVPPAALKSQVFGG